jgi:hypothetical protein
VTKRWEDIPADLRAIIKQAATDRLGERLFSLSVQIADASDERIDGLIDRHQRVKKARDEAEALP